MKQILVIDDDIHIGNMLEEVLTRENYAVTRAYSDTEALLSIAAKKTDFVLLDLMLPGLSGEEVLPQIKNIPVIIISAKSGIDDKVELLLGGAVDYVTKPFEIRELLARIQVHLRKQSASDSPERIEAGTLAIDTLSHTVFANGTEVRLTKTEYAILKLMMINAGQVLAKSVIFDRISADTPDCTESSLKQHMSNLRKKLRDAGGKDYIEAVWGIGFRLAEES